MLKHTTYNCLIESAAINILLSGVARGTYETRKQSVLEKQTSIGVSYNKSITNAQC